MKSIIKKYLLPFILLFGTNNSLAQSFEQTMQMADSAFSLKNMVLAAKLYTRALYFAHEGQKTTIYEKLADTYFKSNDYQQAEKYYKFASFALNDSALNGILLQISTCQIMQKKYLLAQQTIYALPDSTAISIQNLKNFQLATIFYAIEDFNQAEKYFLLILPDTAVDEKNQIQSYFNTKKYLYRPNPKFSFYSSLLIPGSGQLWAGDYKSSLNSIALVGGLALLSGFTVINYGITDAFIAVFPWFFRYYQGGAIKAEKIAIQKRTDNRASVYQNMIDIISPYLLHFTD